MATRVEPLISRELRKSAEKLLRQTVSSDLFRHSKRVEETARDLAKKFGLDESVAGTAALLHDCAKELAAAELLRRAEGSGITVFRLDRQDPPKLHARVGAIITRKKYGISNLDVLAGIRCHTYGESNMCKIAMLTIVADDIEPERDATIADPIRAVLKQDENNDVKLDRATLVALSIHFMKAGEKFRPVHPLLNRARNHYISRLDSCHKHRVGLLK